MLKNSLDERWLAEELMQGICILFGLLEPMSKSKQVRFKAEVDHLKVLVRVLVCIKW